MTSKSFVDEFCWHPTVTEAVWIYYGNLPPLISDFLFSFSDSKESFLNLRRFAWCLPFLVLIKSLELDPRLKNGLEISVYGGREGMSLGDLENTPIFFLIDFDYFISINLLLCAPPLDSESSIDPARSISLSSSSSSSSWPSSSVLFI